jgi:hypothetical protein
VVSRLKSRAGGNLTEESVKRVLDTSVGRVVLEFTPMRSLVVSVFDGDGWQRNESEGDWDHDWDPEDVADALVDVASVPREEAEAIERLVLQEFKERGAWRVPDDAEYPSRWERIVAITLIAFLIGALVIGLGTIIVFLWDTFPAGAIIFGAALAYGVFLLLRPVE